MRHSSVIVPRLVFALSFLLAISACSGDAEDEPRAEATEARASAAAGPVAESAGAKLKEGEFVLEVSNGSYLSKVLPGMYRERCIDDEGDELECGFLRRLLVVEVTMALEEIARSRDQRGADEALNALAADEEPAILIAALRVLGQFPDTPGIADKALPLMLDSPWLMVQQLAASLLASNPDAELASVGAFWDGNHSTLYAENDFTEYPDFALHYRDMDFPEYPDAEWFSPADSDRSVGWWTADGIDTVKAWLAKELGTEGLEYRTWAERLTQESMAAFNAIDPVKQAEMERLTEEWVRTQNMAVLEKLTKLQEELYAPVEAAGEVAEQGVSGLGPPSTAEAQEQVRFFVAEERGGHVARLVIAYPLASLGRTVIQHAWSLADYPSAWPPTDEMVQAE